MRPSVSASSATPIAAASDNTTTRNRRGIGVKMASLPDHAGRAETHSQLSRNEVDEKEIEEYSSGEGRGGEWATHLLVRSTGPYYSTFVPASAG